MKSLKMRVSKEFKELTDFWKKGFKDNGIELSDREMTSLLSKRIKSKDLDKKLFRGLL